MTRAAVVSVFGHTATDEDRLLTIGSGVVMAAFPSEAWLFPTVWAIAVGVPCLIVEAAQFRRAIRLRRNARREIRAMTIGSRYL